MKSYKIAIGADNSNWSERFSNALDRKIKEGYPIISSMINLGQHNWIEQLEPFDLIFWNPIYMGTRSASFLKEKIYFIQNHLKKRILPNFETIWHFESKVAQSYMFQYFNVPTPRTCASFDVDDALNQAAQIGVPLVFKDSAGAASKNVWLAKSHHKVTYTIENQFHQQLWDRLKAHFPSKWQRIIHFLSTPWFLSKVKQYLFREEGVGYSYFQEFIPNNQADLRITAIGDCFAYGFWRHNRPNDFRASGSGLIDYKKEVPLDIVRYCLDFNKRMGFDSMCYDILFRRDDFVINEMSYNYVDRALFNAPGHYKRGIDGKLNYSQGNVWPQTLWVEWGISNL